MKLTQMTIGVLGMSLLAVSPGIATAQVSNLSDIGGPNLSDITGPNLSDITGADFSANPELVSEAKVLLAAIEACQANGCSDEQSANLVERGEDLLKRLEASKPESSR